MLRRDSTTGICFGSHTALESEPELLQCSVEDTTPQSTGLERYDNTHTVALVVVGQYYDIAVSRARVTAEDDAIL